jgi:hypothetical protein
MIAPETNDGKGLRVRPMARRPITDLLMES